MDKWCSCNPLREAQAKAAKWDAFVRRSGGFSGLVALMQEDCATCAARGACNDNSGTCEETRVRWLLEGVEDAD